MNEQHIDQLKSRDPDQRRSAIIALSKTADTRALELLERLSKNDPDPALRDLASKAMHLIQKARWEGVAEQSSSLYVPRPAEPVERPQEVSLERQKKGKMYLTRAFDFRTKGDTQNALASLMAALKANPTLTKDSAALSLAADLVGAPPDDAVTILLEGRLGRVIKRQAGPVLDIRAIAGMRIMAVEIPILYLVLVVLAAVIAFRVTFQNPALRDLVANLTMPNLLKAAPVALLLLAFVVLDVVVMYIVGLWMGGVGSTFRFGSTMLGVAVFSILIAMAAIMFFPIISVVPVSGGVAIFVDLKLVLFGAIWNLIFQGYFAARAHDFKLPYGILTAIIGTALTFVLANLLGILKGVSFG